jgi:hypothetical protein
MVRAYAFSGGSSMTTASGVAVVATRIAHTDRRALSQAWYSALHLAHDTPAATHPRGTNPPAGRAAPSTPAPGPGPRSIRVPLSSPSPARSSPPLTCRPLPERRCDPSPPVRRIERAVARMRAVAPVPNAQTVTLAGGRVHVMVRCAGGTTRVVALCPPALRTTVERALAHARFTLAAGRA